jgi:hypothetical protein
MSVTVTIFVPARSRNWTSRDLQAEIRKNGFALELESFDARKHGGAVPCKYQDVDCYFEYSRDSLKAYLEAVEEMREDDPDDFPYSDEDLARIRVHDHVVQLTTHSSFRGMVAAVIAAASLATLTGGWVLDEAVWKWISGPESVAWAQATERKTAQDIAEED